MDSPLRRLLLLTGLALAGVLCVAPAAFAAAGKVTVAPDGSEVSYSGTADVNTVAFGGSFSGRVATITEAGIADPPIGDDASDACSLSGETLTCTDADLDDVEAFMAAGNDVVTLTGTQFWFVDGDEDNDTLTGSDEGVDSLFGDLGNDTIDGRGNPGGTNPFEGDDLGGGDGNDTIRGGAGGDSLFGGQGDDELDGGEGDDFIFGGDDTDTNRGGPGDDQIDGGDGGGEVLEGGDGSDRLECRGDNAETFDGGPGFDEIACFADLALASILGVPEDFVPDNFFVDLGAGVLRRTNNVPTQSTTVSVEDAVTGAGDDELIGTDGANLLNTGPGNDRIDGRGGTDQLTAGSGSDTVEANDAQPDRVDGGPDGDVCNTDQLDSTQACENLAIAAVPGPPPASSGSTDRTGPGCRVSGASGNFSKGQVAFTTTCNEGGTLAAEVLGRLTKLPRNLKLARVGDVVLVSKNARVTAGRRLKLTLKLSKRYKRSLRKRGRVRVVLHATDALGNQSVLSKSVRLR